MKNSVFKFVQAFVDVKLSMYLILGDFLGLFFQDSQIPDVRSLGRINLVRRRQCLCVLSMDLAPCHPSGDRNFEMASTFLKKLCPSALRNKISSCVWKDI